jgi:flagellar hook assembly protein FlgD
MPKRMRSLFFVAMVGLLGAAARLSAANAATILSLSFANSDPQIHIGSVVTVNMVVMNVTQQLSNVTVTGATVGNLTLGSTDLLSVTPGTPVYITDGTRTWHVTFLGGSTVTINNVNFVGNLAIPGWSIADYTTMQNQLFRVYTGALIGGNGAVVQAELGTFGTVVLNDNGASPDGSSNDFVYSGQYTVPNLLETYTGVRVYGHAQFNGNVATNDLFPSPGTFSLDGLLPALTNVLFTVPNKPNYNNVMYLSGNCQGGTVPDPTNSQGRFDITVNKVNTTVDITIQTVPPKSLPSIIIPGGSQQLTGFQIWNGDNGNGVFVQDGVYTVNSYIHDTNNVTGVTQTSQVRLVSMRYEVSNIRLTPSGRQTQPSFTSGIITELQADVAAYRDGGGSLRASLLALGWPANVQTLPYNNPPNMIANDFSGTYVQGGVYGLQTVQFLDNSNVSHFGVDPNTGHDGNSGFDTDGQWNQVPTPPGNIIFGNGYTIQYRFDPYIDGGGNLVCGSPYPSGDGGVPSGDGNLNNDWDSTVLEQLAISSGTVNDPTRMDAAYGVFIDGASPSQGNYRLLLRSELTGLDAAIPSSTGSSSPLKITGSCGSFSAVPFHFWPTVRPDLATNAVRGSEGIYTEDSSFIFQVSDVNLPPNDTTPPVYITSDPQPSSLVGPNVYTSQHALSAQFQDLESGMNNALSKISVTDPQGGNVPGIASNDGGNPSNNSLTLIFTPGIPLNKGGLYTMTVTAVNGAGLTVIKAIPFTVQDQTSPSVSNVNLVTQLGVTIPLSIAQSAPQGPFQDIDRINVTLSIPGTSTNSIDWTDSNVTLYQLIGGTKQSVKITRVTVGVPANSQLQYSIDTVINGAGVYEVDTQTFAKDSAGNVFSGPPAGTINPQFSTIACASCITVLYSPGLDPSRPAINTQFPITVTAGIVAVNPATIAVKAPTDATMPPDPTWVTLVSSLLADAMGFYVNSVAQVAPMTWTYAPPVQVQFKMYYQATDLPVGIKQTDLFVRAYNGTSWSTLGNTTQDTLDNTNCAFSWEPNSAQQAAVYYAVKYQPSSGSAGQGTPLVTPAVLDSRSFNPAAANPIYRLANFYYGVNPAVTLDVRIFDTAGHLVRTLSLGHGINPNLINPTNNQHEFQWDGTNDSGTLVRNGIYLVRWVRTLASGASDTELKAVALIK